MYSDIITDSAMDSMSKLAKMLRGWLVYEMAPEDIEEAQRRTLAWQSAHVAAHGPRYTTINHHRAGHVAAHVLYTGPLVNTACNTGERKNGTFIKLTPVTNGHHVDRAYAASEARMRAAESRTGYPLDQLAADNLEQEQRAIPIMSMPLNSKQRSGVRWTDLYPGYTNDELRDLIRDYLVKATVLTRSEARWRVVEAHVMHFGMCTKGGETYRAQRITRLSGQNIKGDCVIVTNPDPRGDWELGYARIRNIMRVTMQDGVGAYDLVDADWFVCSGVRGHGGSILLLPKKFPLQQRLFPVSSISSKFYVAPEWDNVDDPNYFYMINCTESKNQGMGWDIGE